MMAARSLHSPQRHPLTLCASLVQNPMNLGALCRTAEVWRLQELVLSNADILTDREFRKVAVSADQWQPIGICPSDRLPHWITHQQQQGIIVIALTRHPRAIALPQFTFPVQSALLLGRELTGIPDHLVQQCDAMLEIPQWGQVESLNVATAGAIAAYEYLRQYSRA
ncbi:TrmH family RNA methyltransferase [Leptolyngbya iicbica LK]|uniref:TrmH family RNA methyltransferase n=3 Tax=Cyanophyceae TaxID=3028117 RepID=A0A4Q7E161_9CYAN|nr:TrmH family RNA methyltransferase [Leptolyngbya sp. LK]